MAYPRSSSHAPTRANTSAGPGLLDAIASATARHSTPPPLSTANGTADGFFHDLRPGSTGKTNCRTAIGDPLRRPADLDRVERARQVLAQVLDVLEADRQPDGRLRDAHGRAALRTQAPVRRGRRVRRDRLRIAQVV